MILYFEETIIDRAFLSPPKPLALWLRDPSSPELQYLQQSSMHKFDGEKKKEWRKMGQNAFEELSAPQGIRQVLQQCSQPCWSTSSKSYQSQRADSVNEGAQSIWCSFPFAVDQSPPHEHIPKQFHALGKSRRIQLATQI